MRIFFFTLIIYMVAACTQESERIAPQTPLTQASQLSESIVRGKQEITQESLPLFYKMLEDKALLIFAEENHLEFTIRDVSSVEFSSGISEEAVFVDLGYENGVQSSFVSFGAKTKNTVMKAFYTKAFSHRDNQVQVEVSDLSSGRVIAVSVPGDNLELASILGAYQVEN
ncbi:MAG: hypothetical protein NW226_18385 [Microscillaceae bacterium]|nr:hypothetical protein [Microscillaceae bacterium]